MSNKTISHACGMLRDPNVTLKDVLAYLNPFGLNIEQHPNPVVIEAWHIVKRQIYKRRAPKPDAPPRNKSRVGRVGTNTRAQRRNKKFGRKARGNTTPLERRAIWKAAS